MGTNSPHSPSIWPIVRRMRSFHETGGCQGSWPGAGSALELAEALGGGRRRAGRRAAGAGGMGHALRLRGPGEGLGAAARAASAADVASPGRTEREATGSSRGAARGRRATSRLPGRPAGAQLAADIAPNARPDDLLHSETAKEAWMGRGRLM